MRDYKVQRPSTVWIETTVEAEDFEEALSLADCQFYDGQYSEIDETFEIDYDRHWIQDEDGDIREGTTTYELAYREESK